MGNSMPSYQKSVAIITGASAGIAMPSFADLLRATTAASSADRP